jgi:hypothetical protein
MVLNWRTTLRHIVTRSIFFLPEETQTRIERRMRGREDFRKLSEADCVIVSFGKSGRTWLRVMISRFYQIRHGLAERHLLAFDNLHDKNSSIPKIFFTHDNYLKDFTDEDSSKADYYNAKLILMVRDPADVAVSQYFQWKYRMTDRKKRINQYPRSDVSLFEFVMNPNCGLPKIIDFMNGWAREVGHMKHLMIVRYEDLRTDPGEVLRRILEFIGTPGKAEEIAEAVRFGSVENMRALESKRVFWLSGRRMTAPDTSNPQTFKVRRAKVGGYRDDFTAEQLAEIDALTKTRMLPAFGYGQAIAEEAAAPATAADGTGKLATA